MEYIAHLRKDKKLAPLLTEPIPELKLHKNIPLRLMAAIMAQQLSTKVAQVIFKRFLELYGGKEPKPQQVIETPHETLRGIGLSNAKANYVRHVAQFCIDNKVTDKKLLAMNNEEIIDLLVQIKGVGKWTAEMLLMFTLGRENVFAPDDFGIQTAMAKIYALDPSDKKGFKNKIMAIAEKWSPYKTYACMHLWRWKDAPGK